MDQYAGIHQLGFYLTGGASNHIPKNSLGGVVSSYEYREMGVSISSPIPGLRFLNAFGNNGEGSGSLQVNADGNLVYTPPGGAPGTAVAIAVGQTKLVLGLDGIKGVLVSRETSARAFAGLSTLTFFKRTDGVVSMSDVGDADRQAGSSVYRCLVLTNQGDATLNNIQLWVEVDTELQSDYYLGQEPVESDGVQSIEDETTAPSGISFSLTRGRSNSMILSSMDPGDSVAIWIKRVFPASGTYSLKEPSRLRLALPDDSILRELPEFYRVADDSLERYELFLGEDQAPDLDGTPAATSQTLPFTYAVTPPASGTKILYAVVRKRNKYGLVSFNQWAHQVEVDDLGIEVPGPLSAPVSIKATAAESLKIVVTALYSAADRNPATSWKVWAKEGSEPVPGVDDPVVELDFSTNPVQVGAALRSLIGPFTEQSTVYVLVGVEREEDSALALADVVEVAMPDLPDLLGEDASVFGGGASEGTE